VWALEENLFEFVKGIIVQIEILEGQGLGEYLIRAGQALSGRRQPRGIVLVPLCIQAGQKLLELAYLEQDSGLVLVYNQLFDQGHINLACILFKALFGVKPGLLEFGAELGLVNHSER